jgi:hypothetical protein
MRIRHHLGELEFVGSLVGLCKPHLAQVMVSVVTAPVMRCA